MTENLCLVRQSRCRALYNAEFRERGALAKAHALPPYHRHPLLTHGAGDVPDARRALKFPGTESAGGLQLMHLTKQEAAPFQALAVGHKAGVLVEPQPTPCGPWWQRTHSQVSHPPQQGCIFQTERSPHLRQCYYRRGAPVLPRFTAESKSWGPGHTWGTVPGGGDHKAVSTSVCGAHR